MRRNLWSLSFEELEREIVGLGYPAYRAKQLFTWLWQKGVIEWKAMSDIPKTLREKLTETFEIPYLKPLEIAKSSDGTEKFLFLLPDGMAIESVLIPHKDRRTLCISSQVGCGMNCQFCATGQLGLRRNLTAYEIFWQAQFIQNYLRQKEKSHLTHIVYMGMGEPLLNLDATITSWELLHTHLGLSYRRITVSTVGIPKGIRKLATLKWPFHLAVSLHSAVEKTRAELIPLARRISLSQLHEGLQDFCRQRQEWVTLEYVLLDGVNDDVEHAQALIAFMEGIGAKINIIPYNPVPGLPFRPSRQLHTFTQILRKAHLIVNIRRSRGQDIAAACGQLALQKSSATSKFHV